MRASGALQDQAAIRVGFALAVVVALVGCSGSTGSPDAQPATSAPAASTVDPAPTADPAATADAAPTAAPSVEPGGAAMNTAVVVVGSERFEFTDVRCDILTARYIQAGNYGVYPEVIIVLPPEGWESQGDVFSAPSVTVSVGDAFDSKVWVAGDDGVINKGQSQIDSYTVPDGRPVTATGTATFINATAANGGGDPELTTGSFEVTCP